MIFSEKWSGPCFVCFHIKTSSEFSEILLMSKNVHVSEMSKNWLGAFSYQQIDLVGNSFQKCHQCRGHLVRINLIRISFAVHDVQHPHLKPLRIWDLLFQRKQRRGGIMQLRPFRQFQILCEEDIIQIDLKWYRDFRVACEKYANVTVYSSQQNTNVGLFGCRHVDCSNDGSLWWHFWHEEVG